MSDFAGVLSYKPTPDLPDDEGKALLRKLNDLYGLIDFDESGKKRRHDSRDRQYATTTLRKAVLDAADHFSAHEKFTTWLCQNNCEYIEAYDPLRIQGLMLNEFHNLRWKVDLLEDRMKNIDKLIRMIVMRLPPEVAKEEKL
jgi:hypothetical protein